MTSTPNIVHNRELAKKRQGEQAEVMLRRTKRRLETVTEGDNVIVPIPAVDRGPLDPSNIQGVILSVTDDGYKKGSKQMLM